MISIMRAEPMPYDPKDGGDRYRITLRCWCAPEHRLVFEYVDRPWLDRHAAAIIGQRAWREQLVRLREGGCEDAKRSLEDRR